MATKEKKTSPETTPEEAPVTEKPAEPSVGENVNVQPENTAPPADETSAAVIDVPADSIPDPEPDETISGATISKATGSQRWIAAQIARDREAQRVSLSATGSVEEEAGKFARIKAAIAQRNIVSGSLISAENLTVDTGNGKSMSIVMAVCDVMGVAVHVPVNELWVTPPDGIRKKKNESYETYLARVSVFIMNMVGNTNFPLVITSANFKRDNIDRPYAVIGSRRMALLRQINGMYGLFERDGKIVSNTNEGDVVTATVMSSNYDGVHLNIRGIDLYLPAYRLTYRYVPNATQKPMFNIKKRYRPGDEVLVRISEIIRDNGKGTPVHTLSNYDALVAKQKELIPGTNEYESVSRQLEADRIVYVPTLHVSGREIEAQMLMTKNKHKVRERSRYVAYVTSIWQGNANPYIRLYLPDVDLIAQAIRINYGSRSDTPKAGDAVMFEFSRISERDPNMLFGRILKKLD